MLTVYIAPNTWFDFTLVGFQKLTVEQAEAAWARECPIFARASATCRSSSGLGRLRADELDDRHWVASPYTTQGTNFIARAAQAGSEFVCRLTSRSAYLSFEKSTLSYSYDAVANAVSATVGTTGSGLGNFALDLGNGQHDQERDELVRRRQRQRLRGQVRRQLHDRARRRPGLRHAHLRSAGPGRNCSA